MPVISALGMQEDCKYEASLGYKMRLLSQKKKKTQKAKKHCQLRIPCPVKISLKNEREVKIFLGKRKRIYHL
jgi:hypothetical protein